MKIITIPRDTSSLRPLLPALDADEEIERLQSIIQAQRGTITELQQAIYRMANAAMEINNVDPK